MSDRTVAARVETFMRFRTPTPVFSLGVNEGEVFALFDTLSAAQHFTETYLNGRGEPLTTTVDPKPADQWSGNNLPPVGSRIEVASGRRYFVRSLVPTVGYPSTASGFVWATRVDLDNDRRRRIYPSEFVAVEVFA